MSDTPSVTPGGSACKNFLAFSETEEMKGPPSFPRMMLRRTQSTIMRRAASAASQPIFLICSIIAVVSDSKWGGCTAPPRGERLANRSLRKQPHDDSDRDQTDQTVAAEVLHQRSDVRHHAAKEWQRSPHEQRRNNCERQQHQTYVRERPDP